MQKYAVISDMAEAIEDELKHKVYSRFTNIPSSYLNILTFHLGWTGEGCGKDASGKRIRPILLLLITGACGHDWQSSLPAAASVELVHNFSLIHDDIQDKSLIRRGRPTVWKKWGIPLGINAGDALFSLANLSLLDLATHHRKEEIILSAQVLHLACLNLTMGQHADIESQGNISISVDDYQKMIENKTASLFSASTELGALLGRAKKSSVKIYKEFGRFLGLAFQIQDDYLGIWGDEKVIGKSNTSDIESRKLSFPILIGLQRKEEFSRRWKNSSRSEQDTKHLISLLEQEDIQNITRREIKKYTNLAHESLLKANPLDPYRTELISIVQNLEDRGR